MEPASLQHIDELYIQEKNDNNKKKKKFERQTLRMQNSFVFMLALIMLIQIEKQFIIPVRRFLFGHCGGFFPAREMT